MSSTNTCCRLSRLYLKATTRALCHPPIPRYPPIFISTWRTWKVGITNHTMEQLLEDPACQFVSEALLQRFARAAFCSHRFPRFPKSSRNGKAPARLYFGCRDAKLRGMNSIMCKVVKQRRMTESSVVAKLCVCVLDHTKGRRTLLSHLIRNRTTCSRMTRARSTGGL